MIKKADIARHWGCKPCYLSWLTRQKSMPSFSTLTEADAWRAVNAPPRVGRPVLPEKIASTATPPEDKNIAAPEQVPAPPAQNNAAAGILPAAGDGDFTEIFIAQSRAIVQSAYGLYVRASATGRSSEVANALANWAAAVKAAESIIDAAQSLRERSGLVIDVDINEDILGTCAQQWRHVLLKFGERVGHRANPENPVLAVRVINDAMDEAFRFFSQSIDGSLAEIKDRALAAVART